MEKPCKVAYSHIANAGDLLNIYIMRQLFGIDIEASSATLAKIVGIGSHLGELQRANSIDRRARQFLMSWNKTYVWSTGFLNSETNKEASFYKLNIEFCALRGDLSKQRVERLTGKKLNICLADGGLLTERLFKNKIPTRYSIGIIPHYKEKDESIFGIMKEQYRNATIIDLTVDPMEVYKKIASCEYILSTSLHGLIMADSFGIPNLHIHVTNKMKGDGFKYADYYSAFGITDIPKHVKIEDLPSINDIIDCYRINPATVEKKKDELIKAFPRFDF